MMGVLPQCLSVVLSVEVTDFDHGLPCHCYPSITASTQRSLQNNSNHTCLCTVYSEMIRNNSTQIIKFINHTNCAST